jgi:hypothetical protein
VDRRSSKLQRRVKPKGSGAAFVDAYFHIGVIVKGHADRKLSDVGKPQRPLTKTGLELAKTKMELAKVKMERSLLKNPPK